MISPIETISYPIKVLTEMFSHVWIKVGVFAGYLLAKVFFLSFDALKEQELIALVLLISFDFVTGVAGAKYSGEEIRSSKMARTALKLVFYFMFIAGGHLTEIIIGANFFVDDAILIFLAVTELISIMENFGRLGFPVPQKLLNKLNDLKESK